MNRLQLAKRIKDLQRVIRNAKSYVGVQLADKQAQQEEIATLNTIIADLQAASAALVTERNTARMMYCEYDNSVHSKEWFAEQEGWLDLYGAPEEP